MKTYFAKYLPVEGEIKEGDLLLLNYQAQQDFNQAYCWFINTEIVQGITLVNVYMDNPTDGRRRWKQKFQLSEVKKVKLFLCSRDIKVGDTVIDHVGREWKNCEKCFLDVMVEGNRELSKDPNWRLSNGFKVIGEISANAVWVKEGDEFDGDEVLSFVELKDRSGLIPDYPKDVWDGYNKIFKIKCPTCKTFH